MGKALESSPLENLNPWSQRVDDQIVLRGVERIGSSKPILHFMHGNGFCGLTYAPFLLSLLDEYDLFILDAQGHGDSDAGSSFLGWNKMAEHCLEVVIEKKKQWGERPVIAVAHSFGAIMSTLMTTKEPRIFEQMIFLDPVIFSPFMCRAIQAAEVFGINKHNPMAKQTRKRRRTWTSREEAKETFRERGAFQGWNEEALDSYVLYGLEEAEDGSITLKCPPWLEASIFQTTPRGIWSALRGVEIPTQIVYGHDTFPFLKRSVRLAARLNPNIQYSETAGDHCFMQQYPERTQKQIREFLAKTP